MDAETQKICHKVQRIARELAIDIEKKHGVERTSETRDFLMGALDELIVAPTIEYPR